MPKKKPPTDPPAGDTPTPAFFKYRLPDGTVVDVKHDAVKGEPEIDYTLEGGEIVKAVRVDDQPEPEPVNPIQAAADLAAAENPGMVAPGTAVDVPAAVTVIAPRLEVLPAHLMRLRTVAYAAERDYDAAAEEAKECKKRWEKARETFEAAFDAEVRRQSDGQTPGLPFDGVHMSDTPQPDAPAAGKGPAEIREFPRAVPPAGASDAEPPCHQCGHEATEHPDLAACTHQDGDEICTCGLYERPPADVASAAPTAEPAAGEAPAVDNAATTVDKADPDPTIH